MLIELSSSQSIHLPLLTGGVLIPLPKQGPLCPLEWRFVKSRQEWGIDWPLTCSLLYCGFLNSLVSLTDVALIFSFCLWYSAFYSEGSTCGFIFYLFCSWYRELHHISLVMENTFILFFNNDIFCSFYSLVWNSSLTYLVFLI